MLKIEANILAIFTLAICLSANPIKAGESVEVAETTEMVASWYGPGMQCYEVSGRGCVELTASGSDFDMNDPTIVAHKSLPFGTELLLENSETGDQLLVTVLDRGPFIAGRNLDVTKAGAIALGFYCGPSCGGATLVVTRLN